MVAKWERSRVVIKALNDGGPGVKGYLRRLVRRLNRMQGEVRFVVGDTAPRITIRFLSHREYVRSEGADSVGKTRTRYFVASPGLISARISIDAGEQATPGQVRSTLVHELTHAIGCGGHFRGPDDRRRSVLHESSTITTWSAAGRGRDPRSLLALDPHGDDRCRGYEVAAPLRPLRGLTPAACSAGAPESSAAKRSRRWSPRRRR